MTEQMLRGPGVVRVEWRKGSDVLLGTCHCGATHQAQDPVSMWDWLLAHPVGHEGAAVAAPLPRVAVPA